MRSQLLSHLATSLTATIKVSSELPFIQGDQPLYFKNMKRVYLDEEQVEEAPLIPLLSGDDIMERTKTVRAYLAVDAKNTSTGITSVITTMLNAKTQVGEDNTGTESDYSTDINEDVILYTFEYRMTQITY